MSEQPKTRQELYEEVRQSGGKEVFVLEQMIRLGFWNEPNGLPNDPADEIRRSAELSKELTTLRQQNTKLYNEQALLKELRKKRLLESRQKQKETRERRERERLVRAQNWRERHNHEIIYLGAEVSAGLNQVESDSERLKQNNLPVFSKPEELAAAMNLTVAKLRFLAFDRRTSEVLHYIHFNLPKKTGGVRLISAPMPKLKAAQHWILENILSRIALHDAAHGFLPKRSIVSNAAQHTKAQIVVNFDLENFFPSIDYKRTKGVFRSFGYSEAIATVLALICTAPDVEEVAIDGKTYFVALGARHLPQGAPTSPTISNVACRRLDKSLANLAEKHDFRYTRYADDLTFSTCGKLVKLKTFLNQVRFVVNEQGFKVNESKTRILRRGRQQEVTGIVVNDKLSINRKTLKNFRAVLHQVERDGIAGKRWGNSPDLIAALDGYANFVLMVDKKKGAEFKNQVRRIVEKYDYQKPVFIPKSNSKNIETSELPETRSDEPPKKWWKLW
ncbi:MAG: reverse transcriptase family protein [Pyrinomonadaceae bacterium]